MAEKLASGHTVEEFKGEEGELLKKRYFLFTDGAMKLQPGGWVLPTNYIKYSKLVYDFEVKPTDVFVVTFPKSGTTWVQEIAWNLKHNPDLDNQQADIPLDERSPTIESDIFIATTGVPSPDPNERVMKTFQMLYPGKHYLDGLLVRLASHAPSPRLIKSHLPLSLLPSKMLETSKVIYLAREPRDTVTSYYHYVRLQIMMGYEGNLDEFIEDFVHDRIMYGPYWDHLKSAWELRNHPNLCLVFYEDLKADTVSEVKRIDKFLGTNRTEKQIQNIVHCTSFAQLKEKTKTHQPTSNQNLLFDKEVEKKEGGFFRKGEVGDWKNRFSPEQVEKLNTWIAKNLPQFGENFKYKV